LAIVSSAVINMGVQVSLLNADLHSFRYMLKSARTGSYSSSTFSFFRNLCTDFHCGYTNLHSQQQCIRVPPRILPACLPTFVVGFFMIFILTRVRWNLNVVLICIFPQS
jgi:ABC-type sulfate transport system permease component